MAGRHSAQTSGGLQGSTIAAAVAALLVVGAVGYGGYRMMSGEDDDGASPVASPTGSLVAGESSDATSNSSASNGADKTSAVGGTAALPAGCLAQLDAGGKAITAADASYRDWHGHTQADLDYRGGKQTLAQTQKIWADTKSRGDTDVADFRKTDKTYTDAAGGGAGCATVDRATASEPVKACLDRYGLIDKAVTAGRKVNTDWAAHIQQMKHKDHTDGTKYIREWHQMVANSGPNQRAYVAARAAFGKAPACAVGG